MENPPALTDADLLRISLMSTTDLEKLYRFTKEQLRVEKLLEMTNENVVSVRLPIAVVSQINRLALDRSRTRSQVVRDAIFEYTRRNKTREMP